MLRLTGERIAVLRWVNASEVEAGFTANAELEANKQARRLERNDIMIDLTFWSVLMQSEKNDGFKASIRMIWTITAHAGSV